MKYRINNWDELRDALQREDYVVMLNAGPAGGEEAEVIDYTVGPESYPDQEWLDEEGFTDEEEWYEVYRGTPAIVIDQPMGQGGTNTRILDTVEVGDFEIYGVRAGMYENRRLRGRKNLKERGMTEYGMSRADEIYQDNYERELAKSGDKYIVRPKTQATNRYLTGEFGIRDSYELTFGTLRDLVRTCVRDNHDIDLYETGGDYYYKDDSRIWDVLGFVLDEPLKESRRRARNKRDRY